MTTPTPTIVTRDNFAQAYTNMRLGAITKLAGGVNINHEMPVPPSDPAKQFVVRMNRDTWYSVACVDFSSGSVYITIPESERYISTQIVDENHETAPMIYGSGRHRLTAKTDYGFVNVRALEDGVCGNITYEAGSANPFEVKEWDMESFRELDKLGNKIFASDGYIQREAFGNKESGQTDYQKFLGVAAGWGGAMVQDAVYQTSPALDPDGCYEATFVDPKDEYFWSATVYNADGRLFNDVANLSSESNPLQNPDGTFTLRFGCEGHPNNIPIREGNTTGQFNVLMRHYGPSEQVLNDEDGYDMTRLIRKVK